MKYLVICLVLLVVLSTISISDPPTPSTKVQISPTQEGEKWINVRALVVEWDESPVDNVSPHDSVDIDTLQEWFIGYKGKWYGFSFTRSTPGKYAIRVSFGGHFGGWGVCEKILPPAPIHP